MQKLFNENRKEVTDQVKKGFTKIAKTKDEAKRLTIDRGYFYSIYDNKNEFVGFGIPR